MIEAGFALLMGLMLGSFLNVCIHRLPRDESVVWPGSRCIVCGHAIRWYDNLPVLGWLMLGGRCRDCRVRISWRYPALEALTGVLFALVVLTWGPTLAALKWCVAMFLLLGMIVTDLETRILPDEFTLGGFALGVVAAAAVPFEGGLVQTLWPVVPLRVASVLQALLAAGVVTGAMWLVGVLYAKVRHKEGLGFGDVKMVAMMGAFLGLSQALAAIFIGCLSGAVIGLAYIRWSRQDPATYELPFGSFLGAGAIVASFLGTEPLNWYRQL
jgi:leader peptidase (prepilin peptidase)/N-methyltransferase